MARAKSTQTDTPFQFKQFAIAQDRCSMKVGTDGVLLGAWTDVSSARTALDIGTGTGVIAIMLGQRRSDMHVHAVELEPEACAQARENMAAAPWSDRLTLHEQPVQEFARYTDQRFDLIVSNPPFFSGGTFSDRQDRNQVRHTIKLPHGDLLTAARQLLTEEGRFCVILPLIEGLRFQELAQTYNLFCTKLTEVLPRPNKPVERLLMEFQLAEKPCRKDQLILQKQEGQNNWTEAYANLTRAFYLHL